MLIKVPVSYALLLLQVFQHIVDYTEKKKKKPSVYKHKVFKIGGKSAHEWRIYK